MSFTEVFARIDGFSDEVNRKLAVAVSKAYRWAIRHLAQMPTLDVWYYHVEADEALEVLERLDTPPSAPAILALVDDPSPRVALRAIALAGQRPEPRAAAHAPTSEAVGGGWASGSANARPRHPAAATRASPSPSRDPRRRRPAAGCRSGASSPTASS